MQAREYRAPCPPGARVSLIGQPLQLSFRRRRSSADGQASVWPASAGSLPFMYGGGQRRAMHRKPMCDVGLSMDWA